MPPIDPSQTQFFFERLGGQAFSTVLLVLGIWIVGKMFLRNSDGRIDDLKKTSEERITDLKERLDDHRKRFADHDKQLEICNEDRLRLWQHIAAHGHAPMEFEQTK